MDQETIPELPGTTLRSDIVLPILSDSVGASRITACTIAEASLRKALLVCAGTLGCGLPCAASWNSATRDAKRVVGSPCPNLEALMIKNYGSTPVSGGGDFLIDEWQTLATRCEKRCPSIPGQAIPNTCRDDVSYPLAPPAGTCPQFSVTSGRWRYPALTWLSLEYYQGAESGCAGGLSLMKDAEHTTWVCIYEPECQYLKENDDMACFKYSHIRGEFHFWDFNSELQLVDPLFQIPVSFCDVAGVSQVVNARTNNPIDLANLKYNFLIESHGGMVSVKAGQALDLQQGGCATFMLRRNQKYQLELDGGNGYYLYKAWFFTSWRRTTVTAGLFPMITDDCSSLGATLSWCEGAAVDLDFFVFRPGPSGLIAPDEAHAIYWGMNEHPQADDLSWSPNNTINEAFIRLEVDDVGLDDYYMRTFGPETLFLSGKMSRFPAGKYALMVMAYTGNPTSTLQGDCATVQLYSPSSRTPLEWISVGEKGALANWWHVVTIDVTYDPLTDANTISYSVIDQMLSQGPSVADSGKVTGNFAYNLNNLPSIRDVEVTSTKIRPDGSLKCGTFVMVGFAARSAVTSEAIAGAYYQVGSLDEPKIYMDQWQYRWDATTASATGGYSIPEGNANVFFSATGFNTFNTTFAIAATGAMYFEVFLVPADGQSRIVLRWENTPTDLDIYVIPSNVVDSIGAVQGWTTIYDWDVWTHWPSQNPYLSWDVNAGAYACGCSPDDTPCKPTCTLESKNSGFGFETLISLDRDDFSHGQMDEDQNIIINGPETITFRNLLPGNYEVYVNAYGRDEDEDLWAYEDENGNPIGQLHYFTTTQFNVDVWLGNSVSSTQLVDTVSHNQAGAKWFHAGTLKSRAVTHEGLCAGEKQKLQEIPGRGARIMCYTWVRDGVVTDYPLGPKARRALKKARGKALKARAAAPKSSVTAPEARAVQATPPAP